MNKTQLSRFFLFVANLKQLIIRCACVVAGSITITATADSAKPHIIGFSPDSNHFAFEQYGIQDGSGFPYSEIFVIDTLSDSWVKGSPFRILERDGNTTLAEARRKNKQRSLALLTTLNISQPAQSLVDTNGPKQLRNGPRLSVTLHPASASPGDTPLPRMMLEQWEIETPQCARINIRPKLFRLLLGTGVNNTFILLHEDKRLPKSRGCPLDYSINNVLAASDRNDGTQTLAVLVDVSESRFEGPGTRIMAITSRIDALR